MSTSSHKKRLTPSDSRGPVEVRDGSAIRMHRGEPRGYLAAVINLRIEAGTSHHAVPSEVTDRGASGQMAYPFSVYRRGRRTRPVGSLG